MSASRRVWRTLERAGLLPMTDRRIPSLTTIVAGSPLRGSWWAHPKGRLIWRVANELSHRPETIETKLVAGKVTFVHRKLWPAIVSVGEAREPWQTQGLSHGARTLLRRVEGAGRWEASGSAARELESRLLVFSEEIHTEKGAHAKILESWRHWSRRARIRSRMPNATRAKHSIERALARLTGDPRSRTLLPWMAASSRRSL